MISIPQNLLNSMQIRVNKYMRHKPFPKQRLLMLTKDQEVLFGGAAGGGKSDALLMDFLQYVNVPRYAGIIFRRRLEDLKLPGNLFERSQEWLGGTDAKCRGYTWKFPSGATLTFSYLSAPNDKLRYQGAQFQYIAFDELTQFPEHHYRYLFSRCRVPTCKQHKDRPNPKCGLCKEYYQLRQIPLKIRAATNPGGPGHFWVRDRWNIRPDRNNRTPEGWPRFLGSHANRVFIPSTLKDNYALDDVEYTKMLDELDPVTRAQLLAGNWQIRNQGRFPQNKCGYYSVHGNTLVLGKNFQGPSYDLRECYRYIICDPAASTAEGYEEEDENKDHSYNSIGDFLVTPDGKALIVWNWESFQDEIPETTRRIRNFYTATLRDPYYRMESAAFVGLEVTPISIGMFQALKRLNIPMKGFKPAARDKLVRATQVINRMDEGRVYLPEEASWLQQFEDRLFAWTGAKGEHDDEVDMMAYAGIWFNQINGNLPSRERIQDGTTKAGLKYILQPAPHNRATRRMLER